MNLIAPYFTVENVSLDLEVSSRKRLYEEAGLLFETSYGISHTDAFDALIAREKIGSTCVGSACALPHGRLPELTQPALIFLRTASGLRLDSPDGQDVRLFLCILIPERDVDGYLPLLRECAALLQNRTSRNALLQAANVVDVCRFVHDWEPPNGLHVDLNYDGDTDD